MTHTAEDPTKISHSTHQPRAEQTLASPGTATRSAHVPAKVSQHGPLPLRIGKYQIQGILGRGGMGQVYRAFHPTLERDVAIKLIHTGMAKHQAAIDLFQREARVVAKLRHPGIVQIYDFDVADEGFFMVMEFVPGETLKDRLQAIHTRGERLPLDEALRLFHAMVQAVAYAHSQNVVHRDLKPANVLLNEANQPILADFGLSKILRGHGLAEQVSGGTPAYMSPEQAEGRSDETDTRTDVYTLGVMFYELVTGVRPFSGTPPILIIKHINETPPSPRTFKPDLPEVIEQVILKCLAKNPAERYFSAQGLLTAIEEEIWPQIGFAPLVELVTESINPFTGQNPYRGLQKFTENEAEFFFGRDEAIQHLLHTVQRVHTGSSPKLIAVLGPSGSGKSSLVRAGLMPQLWQGKIEGSQHWPMKVMLPGAHPLESLAGVFMTQKPTPLNPPDIGGKSTSLPFEGEGWGGVASSLIKAAELARDEQILHGLIGEVLAHETHAPSRYVLVIDQFEEIFTLGDDEQERLNFISQLLYVAHHPQSQGLIIITMRADFYAKMAAYKALAEVITRNQMLVGPMSKSEVRQAILLPAEAVGLQLEKSLVEALLADTAGAAGVLPLLQYALLELFNRRDEHLLTLQAYREIGGVEGALAHQANQVLVRLTATQQQIARRIFLRLVHPGEGTADTRRRATLAEVLTSLDETRPIEAVVQILANANLIVTNRHPASGQVILDVAHEALIREWPTLRQWLDEDRQGLRVRQQLSQSANDWQNRGQDVDSLYRGARLLEVEEWVEAHRGEINPLEQAFLAASLAAQSQFEQEREAQRQRELAAAQQLAEEAEARRKLESLHMQEQIAATVTLRRRALWLAIVSVLAMGLAVVAVVFGLQANESTKVAEARRLQAEQSQNQAVNAQGTTEARRLEAEAAQSTAEARRLEAELAQAKSITARQTAEASQGKAEAAMSEAMTAREEAKRNLATAEEQMHDSQSRELAVAALENLTIDPELSILLARRALSTTYTVEAENALHQALQISRLARTLSYTNEVLHLAVSPDGQKLAKVGADNSVTLIMVATGQPVVTFTGHATRVLEVRFSPDGLRLATASKDKTAKIWDVATGKLLVTLAGHSGEVSSVAFSPDGQQIVTASWDKTAKLWDGTTGQLLQTFSGHEKVVSSVAFSPKGQLIVTGSNDYTAKIWQVVTGALSVTLEGHTQAVSRVFFSPDGALVATAGWDNDVKLWEVATGKLLRTLTGHSLTVFALAFNADGTRLASAGADGTAKVWETASGRELLTLAGHNDRVYDVAFSPDGRELVTASADKTVRFWNVGASKELNSFTDNGNTIFKVAFSPDDQQIAIASRANEAKIWDAATGETVLTLTGHVSPVLAVAYSRDGARLVTGSMDNTAKIWDATTGELLKTLRGHNDRVFGVAFSPDGQHVATLSKDNSVVKIWDAETGEDLLTLDGHVAAVINIAYSSDGQLLGTASWDKTAKIWDALSGQELLTLTGHTSEVMDVTFSSDGEHVATASVDRTIKIWRLATGEVEQSLLGSNEISRLIYSPDGTRLAVAAGDKTTTIWEVESGQRWLTLGGATSRISDLAFNSDGRHLAIASEDGAVRLYTLDLAELLNLAQARLTRDFAAGECQKYLGQASCE